MKKKSTLNTNILAQLMNTAIAQQVDSFRNQQYNYIMTFKTVIQIDVS